MPIDFRFSKLTITGFRGFSKLQLDLPENRPLYLIGANNCGKSTVLNAIALALRGGGMHLFAPERFDFHQNADGSECSDFEILLHFGAASDQALPAVQGVGTPAFVHGIRVKGTTNKAGRRTHQHVLFDAAEKTITLSPSTPLSAAAKPVFADHDVGWRPRNQRPHDIADSLPDVWFLKPDNVARSLYEWKTGPLQRIARLLSERFVENKWDFSYQEKKRKMPQAMHDVHAFFRASVDQFPFWRDELKPRLEEALSRYVGRHTGVSLRPDIQTLEEWLQQQLAVAFATEQGQVMVPLDRMGDGWQCLVRIAALDVLRQFPEGGKEKVVLLIEEPETYLHPHLRRKLRTILSDLAHLGWVVICSTHAPEFIDLNSDQCITRLWQLPDRTEAGVLDAESVGAAARFQDKMDERGTHEFFFANKAVFCEGKDDSYALRTFFNKTAIDLDGRSVSIVPVGAVGNLPDYVRMAAKLRIPWTALLDEDSDGDQVKPMTAKIRRELESLKGPSDTVEVWPGDLERCLRLETGKATPEWQRQELEPKTSAQIDSAFPEYAKLCMRIGQWIAPS